MKKLLILAACIGFAPTVSLAQSCYKDNWNRKTSYSANNPCPPGYRLMSQKNIDQDQNTVDQLNALATQSQKASAQRQQPLEISSTSTPVHAETGNIEKWTGSISAGDGTADLTITKSSSGNTAVVDMGAPGCGGGLTGKVIENEDYIVLLGKDEGSDSCIINFQKTGNQITGSSTEGNCNLYHGAACDFSEAKLHRVK